MVYLVEHSWRPRLFILWASQLVAMLAFSMGHPFFPLYVQELGVTSPREAAIWAGLLSSGSAVAMAVMAPVWGTLADRHGRKLMLQRAMVAGGLLASGMGLVANVQQLLVLRTVQGGVAGTVTAARVLATSIVPPARIGLALGMMQMAMSVGSSGGPLIGGLIADRHGYRAAFLLTAVGLGVAAVMVTLFVPEPKTGAKTGGRPSAGFRENLAFLRKQPDVRAMIAMLFVLDIGTMSISPILPLFIQSLRPPGASTGPAGVASTVGLVMAASAVTSAMAAVVIGRLSDRVGHRRVLVVCAVGAGVVYIPQVLVQSPTELMALRALLGIFMGGIFPTAMALIGLASPSESRGWIYGLTASATSLGNAVGPLLGATVGATFGFRPVFGVTAAILLLVGIWVALAIRDPFPPPPHPSPLSPCADRPSRSGREGGGR